MGNVVANKYLIYNILSYMHMLKSINSLSSKSVIFLFKKKFKEKGRN